MAPRSHAFQFGVDLVVSGTAMAKRRECSPSRDLKIYPYYLLAENAMLVASLTTSTILCKVM